MKKYGVFMVLLFICVLLFSVSAEANTTSNLPWDTALKTLADSLTGPVAFSLGLLMIVCGFCGIAFVGAELGGWVKWVAVAAILAGMLGAAPTVLGLFGLKSVLVL